MTRLPYCYQSNHFVQPERFVILHSSLKATILFLLISFKLISTRIFTAWSRFIDHTDNGGFGRENASEFPWTFISVKDWRQQGYAVSLYFHTKTRVIHFAGSLNGEPSRSLTGYYLSREHYLRSAIVYSMGEFIGCAPLPWFVPLGWISSLHLSCPFK